MQCILVSLIPYACVPLATLKIQVKEMSISHLPSLLFQTLHHLHQWHYPQGPWILVRNIIPHSSCHQGDYICEILCPDYQKVFYPILSSIGSPILYSPRKGESLSSLEGLYFIPSHWVITASFFNLPGDYSNIKWGNILI